MAKTLPHKSALQLAKTYCKVQPYSEGWSIAVHSHLPIFVSPRIEESWATSRVKTTGARRALESVPFGQLSTSEWFEEVTRRETLMRRSVHKKRARSFWSTDVKRFAVSLTVARLAIVVKIHERNTQRQLFVNVRVLSCSYSGLYCHSGVALMQALRVGVL